MWSRTISGHVTTPLKKPNKICLWAGKLAGLLVWIFLRNVTLTGAAFVTCCWYCLRMTESPAAMCVKSKWENIQRRAGCSFKSRLHRKHECSTAMHTARWIIPNRLVLNSWEGHYVWKGSAKHVNVLRVPSMSSSKAQRKKNKKKYLVQWLTSTPSALT